jgi:hypothetical protein
MQQKMQCAQIALLVSACLIPFFGQTVTSGLGPKSGQDIKDVDWLIVQATEALESGRYSFDGSLTGWPVAAAFSQARG